MHFELHRIIDLKRFSHHSWPKMMASRARTPDVTSFGIVFTLWSSVHFSYIHEDNDLYMKGK